MPNCGTLLFVNLSCHKLCLHSVNIDINNDTCVSVKNQWQILDFHDGRRGSKPWGRIESILFGKIFVENCIITKEIEQPLLNMPAVLLLMLGVDDAIKINIFLSSINASINLRVNSEAWYEWALKLNLSICIVKWSWCH